MKEIIKKIVIAVVVAAIAIGVAVKFIKGDEPTVDATTTSAAAVDGNGSGNESSEGSKNDVSNNDSKDQNSNSDASTNNGANSGDNAQQNDSTQDNSNEQNTQNGQSVTQGTTVQAPVTDGNGNTVESATQGNQNTQSNSGDVQQSTNAPVNNQQGAQQIPQTNAQQYANKIDVYQDIFSSGRFVMKINDPDLGPVTMGMSGNKMFIDASMEGVTLKMLYDGDQPDKDNPDMGTWYVVIDQIKKYSPMPADMIGDMNVEELTKDFSKESNNVYTKSTETIGGETYDCESSVDENGNTTKYYFKGDVLVRSDSISPSGEISTTEFQEISGNVDESLFRIPDGYAKFDISWLLGMIG